jgi:hypothetical protein
MSMNAFKPSLAPIGPARIVHNDGMLIIATWERHILSLWRSEITSTGVAVWTRHVTEHSKQHPGKKLHAFAYLEPESMFDGSDATFNATVEALKRVEIMVAAMVMVYPRDGFWSAAMRGRLTAMFNESSCGVPYSLHANVAEGIAWLSEHGASDMDVSLQGLSAQFDALRAL